uniref:Uncharacterized protein n=1 Tax=Cacopsylla melanoneura TaxID=428564 RepID=A0A8D8Z9W9_9HEMI
MILIIILYNVHRSVNFVKSLPPQETKQCLLYQFLTQAMVIRLSWITSLSLLRFVCHSLLNRPKLSWITSLILLRFVCHSLLIRPNCNVLDYLFDFAPFCMSFFANPT